MGFLASNKLFNSPSKLLLISLFETTLGRIFCIILGEGIFCISSFVSDFFS